MHHTDVPLPRRLVCHVQDKHNSLAVYDWKEERLLFTACTTKVRNAFIIQRILWMHPKTYHSICQSISTFRI